MIPAMEHCLNIITFFVSVPVLSEKMYFTYGETRDDANTSDDASTLPGPALR